MHSRSLTSRVRDVFARLFGFRRSRAMDASFNDEMAFHVEMSTERNIRAGMAPDEARRVAQVAFGGREQWREAARDEVRSRYLDEIAQDVRYALRTLRRAPAMTAAAMATLVLSIGATSSIFSVLNAALLKRLSYPSPERIVAVCERNTVNPGTSVCPVGGFSVSNYMVWRDAASSFDAFAAFRERRVAIAAAGREAVSAQARITTASLFKVLGARPFLGRFFTDAEDQAGGPDNVVLSHAFWRQHFASDAGIIGRRLSLSSYDFTVIGVTAPEFGVYDPVDVWVPIRLGAADRTAGGRSLRALAILKPGVTTAQADGEMRKLAALRAVDEPRFNTNMTAFVMPLREKLVGSSARVLWTLLGAVGFLLLIACANVANLLLARAAVREREIAVRVSLGASPRRLVRQLLTESVVLAATSAVLGFALALKGTQALVALVPDDLSLQMLNNVSVDWRLVSFTTAVAVACGVLFGLAPALHAARGDVHESLKEGGRGGSEHSRASARMRSAFVVAEMSLALVLLFGAGLMVRSFAALQHVNLGFRAEQTLTARIALPSRKYQSDTAIAAFFEQAEARIGALPGVQAVGAISYLPLTGLRSVSGFQIDGRPPVEPGQQPAGDFRAVTPGYFRAMGIPVKEGRGFSDADLIGSPKVGLVSETLARTFWPNESAVGRFLVYTWNVLERVQIVGVVGDVHHDGPDKQAYMEIYRPLTQFAYQSMALVVRAKGDPAQYARPVAAAVRAVDADVPLASVQTLEELAAQSVGSARLSTTLFVLFGGLGLLLAAMGIYGVMSYTVQQRQQEIGVRIALGASPLDVTRLVVRRATWLSLIGITFGLVLAFVGAGLMRKLLFEIPPHDPATFVTIAAVLATVGVAAAWVPARRAARMDPVRALRS